jgi:FkbM family methyltransferase
MSLTVIYGNDLKYINITNFALKYCVIDKYLVIPEKNRLTLFGKQLFSENEIVTVTYNNEKFTGDIKIDISACVKKEPIKENFTVLYGVNGFYKDITKVVLSNYCGGGILYIPPDDNNRSTLFGDPLFGVVKHMKILHKNHWRLFSHKEAVLLDVTACIPFSSPPIFTTLEEAPCVKLAKIHSKLKFSHGHLYDEYPEQLMIVNYIKKDRKVLEIGSNIGRATSVIASLLEDQGNLVTLECDSGTFEKLLLNRKHNDFKYHAENAALSYKPLLLKSQDCIGFTVADNGVVPGFSKIKTITFEELEAKYSIRFDTLVVDCEGALYYILVDKPDILDGISLVIMENDYRDIQHKNTVDKILSQKGLTRVYFEEGGWLPCYSNFYEVWERLE